MHARAHRMEAHVDMMPSLIAGSTVVYPYGNDSLPALELGASIFVKVNKNLWRASDEFNLTRRDFKEEGGEMGIWDGQSLIFTVR